MSEKLPKTNSCKTTNFLLCSVFALEIHVTTSIEQISLQFIAVSCGDLVDLFFTFLHSFLKAIFLLVFFFLVLSVLKKILTGFFLRHYNGGLIPNITYGKTYSQTKKYAEHFRRLLLFQNINPEDMTVTY